jgi:hypothetical protein
LAAIGTPRTKASHRISTCGCHMPATKAFTLLSRVPFLSHPTESPPPPPPPHLYADCSEAHPQQLLVGLPTALAIFTIIWKQPLLPRSGRWKLVPQHCLCNFCMPSELCLSHRPFISSSLTTGTSSLAGSTTTPAKTTSRIYPVGNRDGNAHQQLQDDLVGRTGGYSKETKPEPCWSSCFEFHFNFCNNILYYVTEGVVFSYLHALLVYLRVNETAITSINVWPLCHQNYNLHAKVL